MNLVTSKQDLSGWGEVFGDRPIATAILDRLLHHSTIVNIKGESYRLKEKRKAGLLTRSDVLAATRDSQAGTVEHGFADSIRYDLLVGEHRYRPKVIRVIGTWSSLLRR